MEKNTENDTLKKLREQYYEAIRQLQNEDDIIANLPNLDYGSFFDIMEGLIQCLERDKIQAEELIKTENDEEFTDYYKEELGLIDFKLKCCNSRLEEANERKIIENLADVTTNKNIIFATTSSGNIYLEKDLKDIPEEYYSVVLKFLKELRIGVVENNEEKGKKLRSNQKLNCVHELKKFNVRLLYRNLSPDLVFVIGAKMKKDDNDKKYRESVIVRKNQTDSEFLELCKEIKNKEKKEKLIEQNKKLYDKICDKIKDKGRGRE